MRKFRFNKRLLITIGIGFTIVVAAIVVIFNLFFANKELNTVKIKNEKVYINFSEEKFEYEGNITLDHEKNITNIKLDNKEVNLYSEPVYYKKKAKLILPVNYSIVFPLNSGRQYKVNYFTTLEKIYNDYYLVGNNLKNNIDSAFLYDGKDYYIFVNNGTVMFNGININITPMSYVNYVYDDKELFIYNYEEDKIYYYSDIHGDVVFVNDKYKVNLSSDTIEIGGKNKLLMKNFDYLKKLK